LVEAELASDHDPDRLTGVSWGYWQQSGHNDVLQQDHQYGSADVSTRLPYLSHESAGTHQPGTLPYEVRTYTLTTDAFLKPILDGEALHVAEDSNIRVDFVNETLSIELMLESHQLQGQLNASNIELVTFWELQPIMLNGSGDFSQHGGVFTGEFIDESLSAVMSLINARSNLDEYFNGSVIWEDSSLNTSR
jgi:hypothetical protein